jgi:NAD(P)-dependent dehydrogenase (short-subunit alcohol dehydrogenase family)
MGLARATGCALELVGRTAVPDEPEESALASAADPVAVRRAIIAAGVRNPAEVEQRLAQVLAAREIRMNVAALSQVASSVRYHAIDVRDASVVQALVADVYARHGRLDGVIHGAGIIEDRVLRDKTPDSFARVFAAKVDGARALLMALPPEVGFLVFFGSGSGVFGNRGQVDYAAANDALDTLAHRWAGRLGGRVLTVDWGPWAPDGPAGMGGMLSAPLAQQYASRGIGLIQTDTGVGALLRELGAPEATPQVLYIAARPEALDD